jgi:hypothetical protein
MRAQGAQTRPQRRDAPIGPGLDRTRHTSAHGAPCMASCSGVKATGVANNVPTTRSDAPKTPQGAGSRTDTRPVTARDTGERGGLPFAAPPCRKHLRARGNVGPSGFSRNPRQQGTA